MIPPTHSHASKKRSELKNIHKKISLEYSYSIPRKAHLSVRDATNTYTSYKGSTSTCAICLIGVGGKLFSVTNMAEGF